MIKILLLEIGDKELLETVLLSLLEQTKCGKERGYFINLSCDGMLVTWGRG